MSKIDEVRKELDFQNELKALINRYNREQRSDTALVDLAPKYTATQNALYRELLEKVAHYRALNRKGSI